MEILRVRSVELIFRLTISILSLFLILPAIAAPVIQHFYGYPAGENFYQYLSGICHQYPTRSFWIFDRPFALCARCTSGYLGLLVAALFIKPPSTYSRRFISGLLCLLPGVTDPLLQLFTSYESTNLLRFITGVTGGIGVYLIINIIPKQKNRRKNEDETLHSVHSSGINMPSSDKNSHSAI